VEESADSDEPPALAHNRVFRLDRIGAVKPLKGEWRFEGLATIAVRLELQDGFRYTPHPGDEVEVVDGTTQVVRPCWSVFWLLQDIARYGERVKVVAPDVVKQRVVDQLQRQLLLYQE
jgi:predicted DNA-binding transcriptional regulator YafY